MESSFIESVDDDFFAAIDIEEQIARSKKKGKNNNNNDHNNNDNSNKYLNNGGGGTGNAFAKMMPWKHQECAKWIFPESLDFPRREYQYEMVKSCLE